MKTLKVNSLIVFFGALIALLNIQASPKVIETSFWVAANCDHCKDRIEASVDVKGIKFAEFDLETKQLTVIYKTEVININQIHQLLAAAGHDTKKVKATDEAYNKITKDCCKYRDPAAC
ncbi:MAG: heavy-metal-associated domain-containing protein, partial [Flavobacteriales bacterium]